MSKLSNKFGDRLNYVLWIKNMTNSELAKLTGISNPSLTRYITGERLPGAKNLCLICDGLAVYPNFLLGYTDRLVFRF